ncbi:hypothetical protein ACHAP5_005068 [Fusarium lateritium]
MKSGTSFFAWATSALIASAVADTAVVSNCCASLQAAGVKNVYYPDTSNYKIRTESYFSVSSQLQPYCIVQPDNTKDVSIIIKSLSSSQCKFAIRSGGHTVWAANNSELFLEV